MAELTGKYIFQDWETGDAIGRGSFGTVYEIKKQDALGYSERAAMKHISIPQSDSDIEVLQSEGQDDESITETFKEQAREILNEYQLMKKLNDCPNIVSCDEYKAVQHDNDLGWDIFIKMELLTPLLKLLKEQILSEEQIRQLGIDLCHALVYCHKKNILHRDIKPQNIFISSDGVFKLGDFGIARIKNGTSTATARIGTYDYMAPEVYHAQHYGVSADICSLGLVLYWLLNNRRCPFQSTEKRWLTNPEKEEARNRRFAGEAIPAPLNGSEELKRIVLKACAYDRKDRYQSAEEMLADLAKLCGERIEIPPVPMNLDAKKENEKTNSDCSGNNNITKESKRTVGPFEKVDWPEKDSDSTEDGKTVGVFTNPPQPKSDQKRKKKQPLWIWIILAVEVVIIGLSLIYIWKKAKASMSLPVSTPIPVIEINTPTPESAPTPTSMPTPEPTPTPWVEGNWDWSLNLNDYVLTITGTGNMKNYDQESTPWHNGDWIRHVVIEEGITGIGNSAFDFCDRLSSVVIPDSVTYIGDRAFVDCRRLLSVEIPDSVIYIGEAAFAGCHSLKSVEIPDSMTAIGNSVFFDTSLESVTIPDSITTIGDGAFDWCFSLTDIYYTGTKEQWAAIAIGEENEPLLKATIHYNSTAPTPIPTPTPTPWVEGDWDWSLKDGVLTISGTGNMKDYEYLDDVPWYIDESSITRVIIKDGITGISGGAFWYCDNLTSVEIPDSVSSIGSGAFNYCFNLTSFTIPPKVTYIGYGTFGACGGLTSISIPAGVTYIGENAFGACVNLKDIYFAGTPEQWAAIEIGEDNDPLFNATIHYNSK